MGGLSALASPGNLYALLLKMVIKKLYENFQRPYIQGLKNPQGPKYAQTH